MSFEIYDFVFYQLLQFDPTSTLLTGNLVHDLLYGILIPTIFLFFLIDAFAEIIFRGKLRHLVSMAALGVILTSGWYPPIAEITSRFFIFLLILSILLWFRFRISGENGIFEVEVDKDFIKGHLKWNDKKIKWNDKKTELENAIRLALGNRIALEENALGIRRLHATAFLAIENEYRTNINIAKSIINKFGKRAKKAVNETLDAWVNDPRNPQITQGLIDHFGSRNAAANAIAQLVKRDLGL